MVRQRVFSTDRYEYISTYSYDSDNNIIEINTVYVEDGGLCDKRIYTYDNNGKLITEERTHEHPDMDYTENVLTYEYDENSNLESCIIENVYPYRTSEVMYYKYARLSDALAAQSDIPIENDNKTNEDNENKPAGVLFQT